jgi:amino acid adenylation domain-containing protein
MQTGPARPSHPHAPTTIVALLREQAHGQSAAPALLAPGRTALSYAGLHAMTQRLAAHLRSLGATPSTRVAVLLPNGPEMAVAFLGVASGATCAPLNPASTAAELRFHLQDLRARMIVLLHGGAGPARDVALELGLTLVEIELDEAAPAGGFRLVCEGLPAATDAAASAPDDVALLLHTSGTTARPKRVPLSQANLMASAHQIAAHLGLSPADRCLNVMPLFHIHGLVGALLATLAGGGSVVCTPGFDGEALFDWIAAFEPSWTTAVPTIHQALLAHGARYRAKAPQHRFRFVRSSSAALPAATLRQLQALLQAPVVEAYGMTEASHQMASNPVRPGEQTVGSVGVAAGAQIMIFDAAGRPVAVGEAGEIAVRGPGVMRGYDIDDNGDSGADAPANADAFHDGWFRTGDLGHLDAQGRLFIAGRLKDIVNRGGEKIAPQEVDDALLEHPALLQAAAFGVPHPSLGEDLAAAVVRRPGAVVDEAALRDFLFARLAAFKVPSQIVFVHRLPTGATGKLQRGGLHRALAASLTQAFVAPGTDDERVLAGIVHALLGGAPIGLHDNFFARGGDSLRGAQGVARINAHFRLALDVTTLFRHPSVAELAAVVGAAQAVANGEPPLPLLPLQPRPSDADPVCSPSQEALWVVERLVGGAGAYNIAQALRIAGALDVPALERALHALQQRHEVLRTGFEDHDGVPRPHVHADARVTLHRVDARGQPDLPQRLADEARRPFDLAQAPLLRAAMWRIDGQTDAPEHVLLLVLHHLVADGWSRHVIALELGALYSAFHRGLASPQSPLPPLPIQFADWARWQHSHLHGPQHAADLGYWRAQLAGLTPLDFPTDHARPLEPSLTGASERFTLPAALLSELQALARAHDATLFMLLLAAFKLLLMRSANQHDVVVGSPVAGRERPELEGLVGYFVNSVVLRTDLSGRPTFAELLGRVRQTTLDALAHQGLPFDRLVAELSPQRDLTRNPLYQVSFALNNQPAAVCALEGVATQALPLPTQTAKFELSLSFAEAGGALHGELEYSTALFDRRSGQRLVAQVQTLLGAIVADPGQRITRLPLMSPAELRQVLVDWNATAQPLPREPVQALFEQQARRTPDAVALAFGTQRVSYRALNSQANQLAHRLRQHGVAAEVPVGVCLERSPALVAALLAVLKAGGALLPLDPALPPERLAFMLQDARAPLVLTQSSLADGLPPETDGLARWCLDTLAPDFADAPPHDLALPCPPGQLACVIYTSGSTGQPKGVLVEHRGWINHVQWMQRTLNVTPQDRFLQITSIGFDAALVELFMPLQAGATLVLAAPGEQRDMARLATLLQSEAITVLQMVPSALRALLAEPHFTEGALRHVICGGEALDRRLAEALLQRLPNATLGNFYGPTETSIDATHFTVPNFSVPPALDEAATVTIGRPIDNTRCVVLDAELQPVPVGVSGELMIGGAGLARGYLNQPALTAERFIADPFNEGARLYRTGDRARWRADGRLDFLGRGDTQVKLRGQRIELGEIEAALKAQPGVRDAAVRVREDVPGLPRLVAYVAGHGLAAPELKAALARRLPEAMVPAAFVVMAQMPRLPNGKLDRHALPAPERPAEAAAVGLRSATEHALAQIWREVLHVEHVGAQDHFFELGGHSLLATQVVSRLRAALRVELPLRAMFEHPTLQALAVEVDRHRAGAAVAPEVMPRVSRDGPLVVSYSQRRMWLVQTLNPQTTAYNMNFGLRLNGPLNADALCAAIDAVVQRHEAFRTRFAMAGDEVMQWIAPPQPAQIERIDLRALPATQREPAARDQRDRLAGRHFDLSVAGLYRIALLQLDDEAHLLLWVIHHVIGDHWSDGILLAEVGQAYAARLQDRAPALPPLRTEYADYAAWQRAPARLAQLEPQMAFWRRRLDGLRALSLPHDLTPHALPSGRGSSLSAHLPTASFDSLKRLCHAHGVTPFMALLACFKLVLLRCSGQTDIVVGSPVANRTRVEAEALVGTLVNTLVMRTDLGGNPTLAELLARVKETALEAFAHQDAPFERLAEELPVERSPTRQPLVQVLFNMINAPFDVNAIAGLTLQPFEYTSVAAQFELGLTVDDTFRGVHLTYSTDLFVRATAERLLASFLAVVEALLADPSCRLADVETRGATERADLARWNATQVPYETGLRLGDLLRRQVRKSPEATAVVFEDRRLNYRELDASARALALRLRAAGAGPGTLVGVGLERGIELVSALLGVVYSGAAYVPLDPSYPRDRLARMGEDARLRLVVSRAAELQHLGAALAEGVQVVHVDTPLPPAADALDFELIGTPDDPAYTIFTSGSTGRPKGAMNSHAAIVNRLQWMQAEYPLTADDRVLQKTPCSFDVSVWEFFWPLITGATLVVARPDGHRDSAYLAELIERQRITVLHFVPSMLRIFLDERGLERCTSVRRVVCSGEALPADAVARFFERLPHSRLCNLYGPTEAAVDVTYWECGPEDARDQSASIPIGRPVANTQIHVLDAQRRPQPIGVPGELYIGGVQVGMGYVGRPELTAERFIEDPFRPGGRLYKTGDLARWTARGVIDYLGRADDQVKIRGNRIELGEIEACLAAHPAVARCVVIVREDVPGDRRLVAYVVVQATAAGMTPDAATLREHLRASLPEYMLPQHFVPIDALPLLPNGKTDRRALPRPDLTAPAADRRHDDAPQTDAERAVAEVWQALLGVRHVGRSDNFFELGGHSLLAMRAVGEIERRAGFRVEMRRLVFESLAQIAAPGTDSGRDVPSIEPAAPANEPPTRRRSVFARLLRAPRRSA